MSRFAAEYRGEPSSSELASWEVCLGTGDENDVHSDDGQNGHTDDIDDDTVCHTDGCRRRCIGSEQSRYVCACVCVCVSVCVSVFASVRVSLCVYACVFVGAI